MLFRSPDMTSPYAFFQFWVNADDRDVMTLVRTFTFRDSDEIAALQAATDQQPHARQAQRTLARDVTTLVHGAHHAAQAEAAAHALFGQGELRDLDAATLDAAMSEAPHADLPTGEGMSVAELLVACGLVTSNGAGRRAINEGGVSINNVRVESEDYQVSADDFLHGRWLVLRRGKRTFGGIRKP